MPTSSNGNKNVAVRHARVASIDIYEIKDSELDIFEKGESASVQLNFAILLFSLAFTSITTLFTASFKLEIIQTTYLCVAVFGIMVGLYLLILYLKTRTSVKDVVRNVRKRMPDDSPEIQEEDGQTTPSGKPQSDNDPVG